MNSVNLKNINNMIEVIVIGLYYLLVFSLLKFFLKLLSK
jgi:hypothetical protein